jgi:hypothetical protein
VFAAEDGSPRQLKAAEDEIVNEYRFGPSTRQREQDITQRLTRSVAEWGVFVFNDKLKKCNQLRGFEPADSQRGIEY